MFYIVNLSYILTWELFIDHVLSLQFLFATIHKQVTNRPFEFPREQIQNVFLNVFITKRQSGDCRFAGVSGGKFGVTESLEIPLNVSHTSISRILKR